MAERNVASWRIILAFLFDLITSFFVIGFLVGWATGNTTEGGFELNGLPALAAIALIVAYFLIANRFLGGTLGKRIFRAVR